jgi:hypothetical protein
LPAKNELVLFLIREDLKSTKLFNGLANVGLGESCYQTHFAAPVLSYAGFNDVPDDLHEFYLELIEHHSEQIEPDEHTMSKHAFNVYVELMMEKRRRTVSANA